MEIGEQYCFAVLAFRFNIITYLRLRSWADDLIGQTDVPSYWQIELSYVSERSADYVLSRSPEKALETSQVLFSLLALTLHQLRHGKTNVDVVLPMVADMLFERDFEREWPELRRFYYDLCYIDELFRDCCTIDQDEYTSRIVNKVAVAVPSNISIPAWAIT